MHSSNPRIVIACTTYNHEKYIARTLESFLMQKLDEPFAIYIQDDASTDNTQAIIMEYEKNIRKLSMLPFRKRIYGKRDIPLLNTHYFLPFMQNTLPCVKETIILLIRSSCRNKLIF